jgi:hypothetical protein
MFLPGDKVYVEESANIDIGFMAWPFVSTHPCATVRATVHVDPESETLCAVEWDEDFSGGIDCFGNCAPHRGQFVTAKHLSLDFEASREVVTIPKFEGNRVKPYETGTTKKESR